MCRVYPFFKCWNVRLSSIRSVRYQIEQKCQCRKQFGIGIKGTKSATGMLKYRTEIQDAGMPMHREGEGLEGVERVMVETAFRHGSWIEDGT
jgi:hypothetical protein